MILVAVVVLGVPAVLLSLLWVFQRRLIYLPDTGPVPPAGSQVAGARDVTLRTADGLALTAWYLPAPAAGCRKTVLLAPGNGGNRAGRADLVRALGARGYGVLLMEYRGYGGNPGSPTETGLAADAEAAWSFLAGDSGLSQRELIYFGESLGGAVITRLALDHPPAGLLLRSPFTELADAAASIYPVLPVRLLLREEYPVAALVPRLTMPLTVVYGGADSIIPPELSRRVAAAAGGPVELLEVPGTDHNDPELAAGPVVLDALDRLAQRAGCAPG